MSTTMTPSVGGNSAGAISGLLPAAARIPMQTLDQGDFLKLLVTQMTTQDPMSPQKDTEFIAQMAQFSALEQTKTMQSDIASLRGQQDLLRADAMLGRTVSVQADKDVVLQGTVTAVQVTNGSPKLMINGEAYGLDKVITIAPSGVR